MECSINNPALSLFMKHLVIGQRQKAPNFSAFHWSPHGSLVSIGQHFVTTRVVHLPKRTETSLITKSDQSGPNHQLLQLCTACTAWSDSDQAVRAVHSCNSWLRISFQTVIQNWIMRNFCLKLCFELILKVCQATHLSIRTFNFTAYATIKKESAKLEVMFTGWERQYTCPFVPLCIADAFCPNLSGSNYSCVLKLLNGGVIVRQV